MAGGGTGAGGTPLWGRPQTHRLRPWGFPTVSPSHPSVFPHHGIQRITVEFSENSRNDDRLSADGPGLATDEAAARSAQIGDAPASGPGNLLRSTLRAGNCALVRADHRPGRAGADTGSETSDRSVPGLVPDESAHHVDHPDRQSCRFRILRARGGSCAPSSPAPGGPGRRWPARVPGHADAAPFLPVAARAGLPGSGVLVRLPADEANRIQSPRLPAAGQCARCPRWRGWWPP